MSIKVEKAMQMHIDSLQALLKYMREMVEMQKKEIATLKEQLERSQKMEH